MEGDVRRLGTVAFYDRHAQERSPAVVSRRRLRRRRLHLRRIRPPCPSHNRRHPRRRRRRSAADQQPSGRAGRRAGAARGDGNRGCPAF